MVFQHKPTVRLISSISNEKTRQPEAGAENGYKCQMFQ